MTTQTMTSVRRLLDPLVDGIPGVVGAMVSSVDGFALSHRLPEHMPSTDPAGLAAMSAAMLGVSNRLVNTVGSDPVRETVLSSPSGSVFVSRISTVAVLTVLTAQGADEQRVRLVSREIVSGIERLLGNTSAA